MKYLILASIVALVAFVTGFPMPNIQTNIGTSPRLSQQTESTPLPPVSVQAGETTHQQTLEVVDTGEGLIRVDVTVEIKGVESRPESIWEESESRFNTV